MSFIPLRIKSFCRRPCFDDLNSSFGERRSKAFNLVVTGHCHCGIRHPRPAPVQVAGSVLSFILIFVSNTGYSSLTSPVFALHLFMENLPSCVHQRSSEECSPNESDWLTSLVCQELTGPWISPSHTYELFSGLTLQLPLLLRQGFPPGAETSRTIP